MSEARPTNWRGLAAVAVFVLLLIGAYLITRPSGAPEKETPDTPPVKAPVIPAPPPPLDRAELIEAAARAADAHATGGAPSGENAELVGRRFHLVMPFGCGGPGANGDDGFWTYDEARKTLRVSMQPQRWTRDDSVWTMGGAQNFEAAEGFWILRPWILSGNCPAEPAEAEPADGAEVEATTEATPSADEGTPADAEPGADETLALVEYFAPGSRRAARRGGRPYTLTTKVEPGEIDLSRGLRLIVEGRLLALPDGQPIACRTDSPDEPPMCLINASMSRVAITDATGQRVLAEWID